VVRLRKGRSPISRELPRLSVQRWPQLQWPRSEIGLSFQGVPQSRSRALCRSLPKKRKIADHEAKMTRLPPPPFHQWNNSTVFQGNVMRGHPEFAGSALALPAVKRALCEKNFCVGGQQLARSNESIEPVPQALWRGKEDARSVKVFDFLICEAGVVI